MPSTLSPPRDISQPFKTLWQATRKALDAQKTWKDSDAELLSRYIRALERAHDARKIIKAVDEGKDERYLIRGRMLKSLREAEQDADARAKMLLLTPESRQKLEVPKGASGGGKFGL